MFTIKCGLRCYYVKSNSSADVGVPCTLVLCAVALHSPEATWPAHGQPCGLMQQTLRLLARHFAEPAASAVTKYNPQRAQHTLCFFKDLYVNSKNIDI